MNQACHLKSRVRARWVAAGAAIAAAVVVSACSGSSGAATSAGATGGTESGTMSDQPKASESSSGMDLPLQKLQLRLDATYYAVHLPILAGIVEGIYKKHGIDLTALSGTGSANTLKTVAAGSDDIGFIDSSVIAVGRTQGIPVTEFFGYLEQPPFAIIVHAGKGISKPSDLVKGKGAFSIGSSGESLFPVFAKVNDLPLEKIMSNAIQVSQPSVRDTLFASGKADWSFTYVTDQIKLESKCHCKTILMPYGANGVSAMSNGFAASESFISKHRALLEQFSQATREAIEWTIKNPSKAIDDFESYASSAGVSKATVAAGWKVTVGLLHTANTTGHPFGYMSDVDWKATAKTLEEAGKLTSDEIPNGTYTNSLLGVGSN